MSNAQTTSSLRNWEVIKKIIHCAFSSKDIIEIEKTFPAIYEEMKLEKMTDQPINIMLMKNTSAFNDPKNKNRINLFFDYIKKVYPELFI